MFNAIDVIIGRVLHVLESVYKEPFDDLGYAIDLGN